MMHGRAAGRVDRRAGLVRPRGGGREKEGRRVPGAQAPGYDHWPLRGPKAAAFRVECVIAMS